MNEKIQVTNKLIYYIWVIPRQIYKQIFDCAENFFPRSIDDKKGHVFFSILNLYFSRYRFLNFSVRKKQFFFK